MYWHFAFKVGSSLTEELLASEEELVQVFGLLGYRPNLRILLLFISYLLSCGPAAHCGLWPLHSWDFLITHNDAPLSGGLLWTGARLVAETSTWQHTTLTTDRHLCPGGIRTRDLSRREAADQLLRPRGYWDRLLSCYLNEILYLKCVIIAQMNYRLLHKFYASFLFSVPRTLN